MLKCEHCNVTLQGNPKQCPLCLNKPVGMPDQEGERYPLLHEVPPGISRTLRRWVAFGSICAAIICVTINLSQPEGGWWSLFVLAGIASLWIDFLIVAKKRRNLPKSILWQVTIVSSMAILWDVFTGFYKWSLNYVLPILCTCAMVAMVLVAKIRRLHIQDYILYLVMDCILGLISFVLIVTGAVSVVIPSAISFGSALIFFAFLIFFEGRALWAEFQRRMHL